MEIVKKGKFLKTKHVWFEDDNKKENRSDVIVLHACAYSNYPGGIAERQYSLISDIAKESIWDDFNKTVKNEVLRSGREGIEVFFYTSDDIKKNPEIIREFEEVFHGMYEEKEIKGKWLDKRLIDAYVEADALLLTVACMDGKKQVWHTYIYGNGNARLLYSCSCFREIDKELQKAIGRANKYLHWQDIKFLKQNNVEKYDWGGLSGIDSPNGIDKFKMSFGGEIVEYYNITVLHSTKARIFYGLKNVMKRIK